ncbi:MAG: hypothetical protein FJ265_03580 [Planctomycetes bacterium]|nr:hypothetical protein [Planctomycetota bacterium]
MRPHVLAALTLGLSLTVAAAPRAVAQSPTQPGALSFVANEGQCAPEVRFRLRGPGLAVQLLRDKVLFTLVRRDEPRAAPVRPRERFTSPRRPASRTLATVGLQFVGAAGPFQTHGEAPLPGRIQFYRGGERIENVPTFAGARCREVYPGIDLVLVTSGNTLKSEWHVRPFADPSVIRWRYAGALGVSLDGAELAIDTALGRLRELRPVAFAADGRPVAASYTIDAAGTVGFVLGPHDPAQALVIDPVLAWSTFLGGDDLDELIGIATDAAGNVYVCGTTQSDDLPVTPGLLTSIDNEDVYLAKLDPGGSTLLRATYFGGGGRDEGKALAIDPVSGHVYLTGSHENAWNMPQGRAQTFGTALVGGPCLGNKDGFLARFDAQLNLVYTTYVGGSWFDECDDVAVDGNGDVYLGVHTDSPDFPVSANAFQTTRRGSTDNAVTKIAANGLSRLWGTYLGGSSYEEESRLAVDGTGTVYVVGSTESADFPTVTNPGSGLAQGPQGDTDVYLARLNATGTALLFSSYLGGSGYDEGNAVAVDAAGNAYVAGSTESANFVPGLRGSLRGPIDGYLLKVSATGNLVTTFAASHLGGSALDVALGLALGGGTAGAREVYLAGATTSTDRFANPVPFLLSSAHRGSIEGFVARTTATGDLAEFAYYGGSGEDVPFAIATTSQGCVIAGRTWSPDLTTTPGAYDRAYSFWGDGFVARFADGAEERFGTGTFGSGPCIPALSASGYTVPGGTFHLDVQNGIGGALGFLVMGFAGGSAPLGCGTIYLAPPAVTVTLPLGGTGPCGGAAGIPFPLPANPGLSGIDLFVQFVGLDPNGCWRTSPFTLSNGLHVRIG